MRRPHSGLSAWWQIVTVIFKGFVYIYQYISYDSTMIGYLWYVVI